MRDSLNFCCPRHEATPVSSFGRELCFYQEEQLLFQCHLVFRLNVPITRRFTGCLFHDLYYSYSLQFLFLLDLLFSLPFPFHHFVMIFCRFSFLRPSWFRIPVTKRQNEKRCYLCSKLVMSVIVFLSFCLVDRATFLSVVF